MNNQYRNKKISILMIATMIFTMIGCGQKQENKQDMIYEEKDIDIEELEGSLEQYCIKNERVYILTVEQEELEVFSEKKSSKMKKKDFRLYKVDLDGNVKSEISLNLSENKDINAFFIGNDDSITYVASYDDKTKGLCYELVKLDMNGKEQSRDNLTKKLNLGKDVRVSCIETDKHENWVLAGNQEVYIFDKSFQYISEVKMKDNCDLIDIAVTKDGQICCAQREDMNGQQSVKVYILDTKGKKWEKVLKTDANIFLEGDCIMDGLDYDFYYKGSSGIFGYNIANNRSSKLLDAEISYLTSQDVKGMIPIENDRYINVIYDHDRGKFCLEKFTKLDSSVARNKQIITYATYGVSDSFRRAAREFNKLNNDYKIEFRVYDQDNPTRLLADFTAGNIPDIIDISSLPWSVEQCVAKGLLEDLTPYYEKDEKIAMDEIVDSVHEAMKIDGKLYYLAPYFGVISAVGKTKNVGSRSGWTFDDVETILEEKGEDVIPFDSGNKMETLTAFLRTGLTDFVDWETGECKFNSQDFKDILELCNMGKAENGEYDIEDKDSRLRGDKILVSVLEGDVSLQQIQLQRQLFKNDITYIGYPSNDRQGSYFEFPFQVGIYADSNVKEKAWEFIRFLMTKEYQGIIDNPNYYAMPTRQDCLTLRIEALTTTEAYTDEFGQRIEPLEKYSWSQGDITINYGPISQQEVNIYLDLINNTKKTASLNEEMMMIVADEAEAYFAGDKELNQTVEIIQQRVETYINEQKK